nr:retrovirus-related Pol polyprotein from transposon TNT 1-94 [Tanacetum cinerariifolium]
MFYLYGLLLLKRMIPLRQRNIKNFLLQNSSKQTVILKQPTLFFRDFHQTCMPLPIIIRLPKRYEIELSFLCKAQNFHYKKGNINCLAVLVFTQGDDLIACLNKEMAFLSAVVASRQGQSYASNGNKGNATSFGGNNAGGQARVVKCNNCQDEEQLAFLADPCIPDNQSTQKTILNTATFQTKDLDAYYFDCDDVSNAKAVLMASLSNYGSNVILELQTSNPNTDESDTSPVKIEALMELPKVESSETPDSNTPVLPSTGLKSSPSASRSHPTYNKKNDRISYIPSRNIKNKVEVQLRRANLSSNKKNHFKDPICDANVNHTTLNTNSKLICVKCKQCMFDANHDVCFLDFVNDVNVRSRSKSAKQSQQHNIWKPTGIVFTEVGYKWKPTRKLFTLVGKSKKSSHQPKAKDTNQEKLYLPHMELCGPMRMESINRKSEDLGKLKAKADNGIFVGYTPARKDFRIYNRRTHKIMETIHLTFDELTAMASEQFSSGLGLQLMTPATSTSRLILNLVIEQPFNPPTRNDWDHLF